jgi:hypothetical protein
LLKRNDRYKPPLKSAAAPTRRFADSFLFPARRALVNECLNAFERSFIHHIAGHGLRSRFVG